MGLVACRGVIRCVVVHRANDGQLVHYSGDMREQLADPSARFSVPAKIVGRGHDLATAVETQYTFDNSNLNPIAVRSGGVDTVEDVNSKVIVSTDGEAIITGAEVSEYINIMKDGDYRYAQVSEWGFYTGQERTVSVNSNGVNLDIEEAIYAQLATKRCGAQPIHIDPANPLSLWPLRRAEFFQIIGLLRRHPICTVVIPVHLHSPKSRN